MLPNRQVVADLVIFTEEVLNRKLHFLCSVKTSSKIWSPFCRRKAWTWLRAAGLKLIIKVLEI